MDHTLSAIDEDLGALASDIVAMGELAVAQVRAAVDAFVRHDVAAAGAIAAGDERLDEMDVEVERRAVRFLALHKPFADDLRRPIAAMKTATQLERAGDLAKNIAKRLGGLEGKPDPAQVDALGELGKLVVERLAAVVAAYKAGDAKQAYEVWANDTDVDVKHEEVVRDIVRGMSNDPSSVAVGAHLLFMAKNLERIGDHATNIAELVHYQLTGDDLANRPKL